MLFSTFSRAILKLKMHLVVLVIKSENAFKMREARIFIVTYSMSYNFLNAE